MEPNEQQDEKKIPQDSIPGLNALTQWFAEPIIPPQAVPVEQLEEVSSLCLLNNLLNIFYFIIKGSKPVETGDLGVMINLNCAAL